MNSKLKAEKIEITIGQRLLQARETLDLSRENVAERLCLKISTIREIEEDNNLNSIDPTFLRGYIRSYAKLVKIPEKEILELLDRYTPIKAIAISPIKSYSLGKICKKQEGLLVKFTWLIIVTCIAMVGIWWWQGYKIQKQEIITMAEQNRLDPAQMPTEPFSSVADVEVTIEQNNASATSTTSPIKTSIQPTISVIGDNVISSVPHSPLFFKTLKNSDINVNNKLINSVKIKTVPLSDDMNDNSILEWSRVEKAATDIANIRFDNVVVINFKGQCWLEVRDSKGKILFSGVKNAGQKLELNGELPYEFNIGIPANVNLLFKGNLVDLDRFIKSNRPAKFKLPGL